MLTSRHGVTRILCENLGTELHAYIMLTSRPGTTRRPLGGVTRILCERHGVTRILCEHLGTE